MLKNKVILRTRKLSKQKFWRHIHSLITGHWLGSGTILAVLLLSAIAIPSIFRQAITIEITSVPKMIKENGYSEQVLYQRILSNIASINESVEFFGVTKNKTLFKDTEEKELSTIQIPGTGMSLSFIMPMIREALHLPSRHVSISLVTTDEQLEVEIRYKTADNQEDVTTVLGSTKNVGELVDKISRQIVTSIDPAISAIRIYSEEGSFSANVQDALQKCIDTQKPEQKSQCYVTWGDLLYDQAKLGEAEAKYKEALVWAKNPAAAYAGLGSLHHERGNLFRATEYYEKAIAADSTIRSVHLNYASLAGEQGDWSLAMSEARKAMKPDGQNVEGLVALGEIHYAMGEIADGDKFFNAAVELKPRRATSYSTWGKNLLLHGSTEEARKKFDIAIKLSSGREQAYIYNDWGSGLHANQQYNEAVEKHRQALSLAPHDAWLQLNYADDLLVVGRLNEAKLYYQAVLQANPLSCAASARLGSVLAGLGDYKAAFKQWEDSLATNPSCPTPLLDWALYLADMGDYAGAIERLHKAQSASPRNYLIYKSLAEIHSKISNPNSLARADAHYRTALRLNPSSWETMVSWGSNLFKWGESAQAERLWAQAQRISPSTALPHKGRGYAFTTAGRHVDAEREYRIAVQKAPYEPDGHALLVDCLLAQGNQEQARNHYLKALEVRPDADWLRRRYAKLLLSGAQQAEKEPHQENRPR